MDNFEFHNPTRILFGKGVVHRAGEVVAGLGKKVLLVTGMGSVKKTGLFDKVAASLEEEGVEFFELDKVQSNPVVTRVRDGIRIVQDEGIEVILALGGGSVMDTSKAIAAGSLLGEGDVWDLFTGKRTIENALPVVTIPTIAASGSEMNGYMVITNKEEGYKLATGSPLVYPKTSLLDPTATFTVPRNYTAYGGVDAVCHLLEPYFNGPDPYTDVPDRLSEGLIMSLLDSTRKCIDAPEDYQARASMMWAATLALNGLTKAGVGEHYFPVHLIEHAVSALFDVPHGAGLSALLPGWMTWRARSGHPEKIAQLGQRVFGVTEEEPDEAARQAISAFRDWLSQIECPDTLEELGISEKELDSIAENASYQAKIWGMDKEYNTERIREVLDFCR